MSLITVVVPVYNTEQYLQRCLDSILEQTFHDFDIALVDDGSQDESPVICDRYAEMDSRVHVFHQANQGLSAARNTGIDWSIKHSNSQYITFIDSDDWVHPRYLELLYAGLKDNNCSVSVGRFIKTTQSAIDFDLSEPQPILLSPSNLYCQAVANFIVAWGKLFQKSDFKMLRFPVGKLHEDEFTTWKILFRYDQLVLIDIPVYAYFQHADSIINSSFKLERLVCLDAMEEQKIWIDRHGDEALKQKIRLRLVFDCEKLIQGMKSINADQQIIRKYRKKLRRYIWNAKSNLSLRKDYSVYCTAWPFPCGTLIRFLRLVLRSRHS